jgi:hypothetical protein
MEQGAWGTAYISYFRGCPAGAFVPLCLSGINSLGGKYNGEQILEGNIGFINDGGCFLFTAGIVYPE